jgi:predicted S18 family serine protease
MEPIAIVKKRSRIWLVMVLLIIIMLLAAAALWFMGDAPPIDNISRLWQGQAWSGLIPGEGRA